MAQQLLYTDARHLLRRATARGRSEDARKLSEMGLEAAVDWLLRDPAPAPAYTTTQTRNERGQQLREISQLWISHWLSTPTPAAERLTLFWSGHLTSEFRETNRAQGVDFWNQFATFRRLGYGKYGELIKAIAKDPVMLLYLNNAESRKEHPNENWARELMELFTVGAGNYTEDDIRQSAKAFTGWSVRLVGGQQPKDAEATVPMEYIFRQNFHEPAEKTFMGKKIKTGDEVLEILIAHPKTYEYVGRKLLKFYLHPEPSEEMVAEAAKVFRDGGTRETLRWLFTQPEFYSGRNRQSIVKSPIEYFVGLLYAAGEKQVRFATKEDRQPFNLQQLASMGQIPFDPPNVAGWDGGLTWLAESPLLARLNIAGMFAGRERNLDLEVFMESGNGPLALVKPEAQLL